MKERKGVAFFGAIGSGKTSSSNKIAKMYEGAEVFSFAKPVKDLAERMLGRKINKATDRLFIAHVGQGARSELLKFLGSSYYAELLAASLSREMFATSQEFEDATLRIDEVVSKFTAENTDWGHKNFWIDMLMKEIYRSDCKIAVIDDLRFQVEYDVLKCAGFRIVKTMCPQIYREARLIARDGAYSPDAENHPSELEWREFPSSDIIFTYRHNAHDPLSDEGDTYDQLKELMDGILHD